MALEALAWPDEPADTDEVDGGQSYNMGTLFGIAAGGTPVDCHGVQWRVPDVVSAPAGGVHAVALWNEDTGVRLAYKEFTPAPGGYQDVLFDAPVAIAALTEYVATIYTSHYVYRPSSPPSGWHIFSPSGNIDAYQTRLLADNSGAASVGLGVVTAALWFYVAPLTGTIEEPDHDTAGTGSLTLSATAARSTARATLGTGAASVSASAARTSARATAGRAELVVAATATRSSSRTTAGTGRLVVAASSLQVRGGGPPRIVTSTQVGALTSTSRPGVITSSTRG
jgi:hypothetical protein